MKSAHYTETLARLVELGLQEDLGDGEDLTTVATVPAGAAVKAVVRSREAGVAAGTLALALTWGALDPAVRVEQLIGDGEPLRSGDVIARVRGPARAVFTGERTALNLLGHLSGIATLTAQFVAAAGGRCAIRDTRKTLPGMRAVQKQAVVSGGGQNHRYGLCDALLVKDNHVAAAGGIQAATRAALALSSQYGVQIEVDNLDQLKVVLGMGARSVLLDNFGLSDLRDGVALCRNADAVFVEASGGVTLDSVADISDTGVDAIAVGALTHSARTLDAGLDIDFDTPDFDMVEP